MKIKTPFTVPEKYFSNFQNYFKSSNEKLVSYTYIPNYLRKTNEKNWEVYLKINEIRNA